MFNKAGGVNPVRVADPVGRYLSFDERLTILELVSAGHGVREIARRLGRSASTISRELVRGKTTRRGYKPMVAQEKAESGRRKRRTAKLAVNTRLRDEVVARLARNDSPAQISGRLRVDFPDDPEMRVSAETIYQTLYIQARGGLKKELAQHLRTHRQIRRPRRVVGQRRGRMANMIMISERPAEVADRAVPGHWESQ